MQLRPAPVLLAFICFFLALNPIVHANVCTVVPPYNRFVVVRLVVDTREQWTTLEHVLAQTCKVALIVGDSVTPGIPAFVAMLSQQVAVVRSILGDSLWRNTHQKTRIQGRLDQIMDRSPKQILDYQQVVHNGKIETDFYQTYWSYDVLMTKWQELERDYQYVSRAIIGNSVLGKEIPVLRIGETDHQKPRRLVITALLHAREWIAASVATYLVERLAVSMVQGGEEEDQEIASILKGTEVVIVPMVNPDGYEYSNKFRMQRKNRRETSCGVSAQDGVDLNRNWSKEWGPIDDLDVDPCSEDYIGQSPFSEPEAVAVRDLIQGLSGVESHLDFHSFGEYVLSPWSYADKRPNDYEELCRVGKAIAGNMSRSSAQNYQFGPAATVLYEARGVISDWMADRGVLSYTVELRPSTVEEPSPEHGFALPTEEIEPTCKESWSAVKVLLRHKVGQLEGLTPCSAQLEEEPEEEPDNNVDVLFVTGVSIGAALFVGMVAIIITMAVRNRRRKQTEEGWHSHELFEDSDASMPRLPKPVFREHGKGVMFDRVR